MVVQLSETIIDELRKLSPERKQAFVDIIENAYRQLGQKQIIIEFRQAVNL